MGKSAGKWIKGVLFGKKHSKSSYSKNVASDKKTPVEDPSRDSSFIPDQLAENLEFYKGISGSQSHAVGVAYVDQGINSPNNDDLVSVSDDERKRQEQAAIKAQAVFRGYLARRAFRALKGIIRLQALIRGHLVRRQAVATWRCMLAIVKFQAVARGRRVRLSVALSESMKFNVGDRRVANEASSMDFLGSVKLGVRPFIRKLLAILPSLTPLSLKYDPTEPNSALNWLERWSISHFWSTPLQTKKAIKDKPQRKIESEPTKSKRTIRKASTPLLGENGSETDKTKWVPRKVTSQSEVAQEHQQSELERVKRSLRKVSASAAEKPDQEIEKPQPIQSVEIVTSPTIPDIPEQEMVNPPENTRDSDGVVDKPVPVEDREITKRDEPVDLQRESYPVVDSPSLENPRIRKRRSLPAKQDYAENISQNSPSLPSYMAATESAKAKLRAQGYAKVAEEVVDYGNARRHSLPAPANGKLSSLSPRIQKPMHGNGKGSIKVNRSLTASRDDKVGWRR